MWWDVLTKYCCLRIMLVTGTEQFATNVQLLQTLNDTVRGVDLKINVSKTKVITCYGKLNYVIFIHKWWKSGANRWMSVPFECVY